jgi:hypothetical protein
VYDLSVLSSLPLSISSESILQFDLLQHLRPLFCIGVNDISSLERHFMRPMPDMLNDGPDAADISNAHPSWIACTTDEVIKLKNQLYDLTVEVPPVSSGGSFHRWPKIRTENGTRVRASQRDWRRYRILRSELSRIYSPTVAEGRNNSSSSHNENELSRSFLSHEAEEYPRDQVLDADDIVEPITWSDLAYSSFMWWASAGERDIMLQEEAQQDKDLLDDRSMLPFSSEGSSQDAIKSNGKQQVGNDAKAPCIPQEIAIIEYFHRLTELLFSTVQEIVDDEATTDTTEEHEIDTEDPIVVSSDHMVRMGLNSWSQPDRTFVEDFIHLYFEKRADVRGASLECCGIKVL